MHTRRHSKDDEPHADLDLSGHVQALKATKGVVTFLRAWNTQPVFTAECVSAQQQHEHEHERVLDDVSEGEETGGEGGGYSFENESGGAGSCTVVIEDPLHSSSSFLPDAQPSVRYRGHTHAVRWLKLPLVGMEAPGGDDMNTQQQQQQQQQAAITVVKLSAKVGGTVILSNGGSFQNPSASRGPALAAIGAELLQREGKEAAANLKTKGIPIPPGVKAGEKAVRAVEGAQEEVVHAQAEVFKANSLLADAEASRARLDESLVEVAFKLVQASDGNESEFIRFLQKREREQAAVSTLKSGGAMVGQPSTAFKLFEKNKGRDDPAAQAHMRAWAWEKDAVPTGLKAEIARADQVVDAAVEKKRLFEKWLRDDETAVRAARDLAECAEGAPRHGGEAGVRAQPVRRAGRRVGAAEKDHRI